MGNPKGVKKTCMTCQHVDAFTKRCTIDGRFLVGVESLDKCEHYELHYRFKNIGKPFTGRWAAGTEKYDDY